MVYLRHNYFTNMEELIFHEKPHCFHNPGRDFNRFTTHALLQAPTIPYWICGEQGDSWIGFYPHASVHLFIHPSLTLNNITFGSAVNNTLKMTGIFTGVYDGGRGGSLTTTPHCLQLSFFLVFTAAHTVFIGHHFTIACFFFIIFLTTSCNGYKNCHKSEGYSPERICTTNLHLTQ